MKGLRQFWLLAAVFSLGLPAAQSQVPAGRNFTRSASGQILVSRIPEQNFFHQQPDVGTNTGMLRLEPALFAVSAERFKAAIWRDLGLNANAAWSGKFFIVLHPARSLDEPVTLTAQPFLNHWSFRLELPDLMPRERCARTLAAVVLEELANRSTPLTGRMVPVPAWLPDGFARLILQGEESDILLSAPNKNVAGVAVTRAGPQAIPEGMALLRLNHDQRGMDSLAGARAVLQNQPALSFDQLSWPTDTQLGARDGGAYLASAQLFVHELLDLNNGALDLRNFLACLPACANWQTAFYRGFKGSFSSPLAVEKWWSLRVVALAAHDPGPQWNAAVSREKLDALLAVPVDVRFDSNALPTRTEISLQAALQNFPVPQQLAVMRTRLRDLELAQLRFAPAYAVIAAGYRAALAEFLGEPASRQSNPANKHAARQRHTQVSVAETISRLDVLDQQRRALGGQLAREALPVPAGR
jgi:hypothetical protein